MSTYEIPLVDTNGQQVTETEQGADGQSYEVTYSVTPVDDNGGPTG